MSINVNLKGNEVEKIKGFEVKELNDKGKKYKEYSLPGICLYFDKGKYHTILHQLTESVPEILKDIVEEISFYDYFSPETKRITGIYQYKSAEAEVDFLNDRKFIQIRIIGKNMEDMKELYRQFRAGKIMPAERWDQEQSATVKQQPKKIELKTPKKTSSVKEEDKSKYIFL